MRVVALNGTGVSSVGRLARSGPSRSASSRIERPSGVSSASEAISAARMRRLGRRPGAATTSVAMRLPKVMVPVLSSSRVSQSPAASTARPEVASTLTFSSRSMPAMPMAESSAADGGRDQADEQGAQHHRVELDAGVLAEAEQGDHGDQEDQGQAGQQHGQRHLVGRLAPVGAFDHGDHAVEEAVARARR